ncbi:MAG: hypothetical protein GPJ54_00890 [Candidatus Heimdallarchaeota archaeon]|nr:hypothetical protein [Candidatus Heimdallarchaeota archaeon]
MTDKTNISHIKKDYLIQAPLDDVWDCLSNSDISTFWQRQDCIVGTKVGDLISLFGGWVTGEILGIEPKKILSYTWNVEEWDKVTEPSKVSYSLDKIDNENTKVKLTHWDLPSIKERDSHDKGWDEQFFDPMIEFLGNPLN